jgi:hypothetical protein
MNDRNTMENRKDRKGAPKAEAFWNAGRSIELTRICVIALLVLCCGMAAAGPFLTKWFLQEVMAGRSRCGAGTAASFAILLAIGYACAAAAVTMLFLMLRFLKRLSGGQVFIPENTVDLRGISWCCVAGAVFTLAVGLLFYLPFLIISGAAGFMALVVRVVKNAFDQAVGMREELDLTI